MNHYVVFLTTSGLSAAVSRLWRLLCRRSCGSSCRSSAIWPSRCGRGRRGGSRGDGPVNRWQRFGVLGIFSLRICSTFLEKNLFHIFSECLQTLFLNIFLRMSLETLYSILVFTDLEPDWPCFWIYQWDDWWRDHQRHHSQQFLNRPGSTDTLPCCCILFQTSSSCPRYPRVSWMVHSITGQLSKPFSATEPYKTFDLMFSATNIPQDPSSCGYSSKQCSFGFIRIPQVIQKS